MRWSRSRKRVPGLGIGRLAAGHLDVAARDGGVEHGCELAAEERPHDLDGEEVAAARGKPARAVRGEPAARHDRMHVGMEGQVARPGVEHHGDAELGAEARRVAAELEQRRRRRGEE
jgi:hypothetical protein